MLLSDAKDPKVNLEPDGVFTFSATAGAENHSYELKLDLYDKVNVEESKINIGPRSIFCILEKVESKWWNKLLRGDAKTPHYVKVDWDKWVDKDDTGTNDLGMEDMDFSSLGGMGGMPGMNDFMGDDLEDSDDEVQEEGTKPDGKDTEEAKGGETKPEVTSEVKAEAPSST